MDLTNVLIDVLLVFYVIVCLLMGFAIMLQRSKQEGLGTAFAGNATSEILGTGASAFLVKATVWLALIFFILSISLARLYSHRAAAPGGSPLYQELNKPVAPVPSTTPADSAPLAPGATPNPATTPATTPAPAATTTPAPVTPASPSPSSKTTAPTPATATPAKPNK